MNKYFTISALLALSPTPAGAAVLLPQTQQRWIEGHLTVQDPSVSGSISDDHQETRTDVAAWGTQKDLIASTFSTTVASGSLELNSPATGSGLTSVAASGSASGTYTATTADAVADVSLASSFAVTFQVDEPVHYRLTGVSVAQQDDDRTDLAAWSLVALRNVELPGDGTTVVLSTLFASSPNSAFEATGTLQPGLTYEVVGVGEITLRNDPIDLLTGQGETAWNFNFEVTPVPEPAAAVVTGLALAAFAGWRCQLTKRG